MHIFIPEIFGEMKVKVSIEDRKGFVIELAADEQRSEAVEAWKVLGSGRETRAMGTKEDGVGTGSDRGVVRRTACTARMRRVGEEDVKVDLRAYFRREAEEGR